MSTAELEREWLVHQRSMAEELPRLVENARAAESTESSTLTAWRQRLAGALAAVGAALQAHVAADEHPEGFLPSSARRAPRLIHALDHLCAEHQALISAVAEAESSARHTPVAGDAPTTIRAVEAVLDRIERHLDTAYRVAMEIANDDLGEGD
jgi:hypothetical protein